MVNDIFEQQSINEIKAALQKAGVASETIAGLSDTIVSMVKSSVTGSTREIKAVNQAGKLITLKLRHEINRLVVKE